MAGRTGFVAAESGGLLVLDYSDPSQPVLLDRITEEGFRPHFLALAGNLLYVADPEINVWLFNLNMQSISGRVLDDRGQLLPGIQVSNGAYTRTNR